MQKKTIYIQTYRILTTQDLKLYFIMKTEILHFHFNEDQNIGCSAYSSPPPRTSNKERTCLVIGGGVALMPAFKIIYQYCLDIY